MTKRIQMTRQRPWRADHPDAVIVARRSKWGNPFQIGEPGIPDAATATTLFRAAILLCHHLRTSRSERGFGPILSDELGGIPTVETIRRELRGKDLACWCPLDDAPCHADVLLEIANA
jgi:hypothetical protein